MPSNGETLRFRFVAVCDGLKPERWHGEVIFGHQPLLSTGPLETYERAGRAAEQMLQGKVEELFGA